MINFARGIFSSKIFFFYLIFPLFAMASYLHKGFNMDDFYLHISVGRWIMEHMEAPHIGILGWFTEENQLPWTAHEWMSEVTFYHVYQFFEGNLLSIIIFCSFLCAMVMFFLVHTQRHWIEESPFLSFLFLALLVLDFSGFFILRPQIFSFSFFFVDCFILLKVYHNYEKNRKLLFIIPLVAILWSNFHGGSSVLSYGLPILFMMLPIIPVTFFKIDEVFAKQNLPSGYYKNLFLVSLLSFFATFINPYGFDMVKYPFENMADAMMLTYITEWRPFNITESVHFFRAFPVMAFTYLILILNRERKIDLVEFILLGIFLIMTLKSVRFVMYFAVFSSLILFKHFSYLKIGKVYFAKQAIQNGYVRHNIKLTCFAIIVYLIGVALNQTVMVEESENLYGQHQKLIQTIREEQPKRIYNFISMGNELMFANIKPFVDGRADLYAQRVFSDCSVISWLYEGEGNPEEIIKKYRFDYLLMNKLTEQTWYYREKPDLYQKIFEDNKFIFFKVNKQ